MSLRKHGAERDLEIAILAGGLSERLGSDKLRLRIGRRTTLGHVRALARSLELPARVIRKDIVPRCGPIGGIYTALKRAGKPALLVLSGDMPFVGRDLVEGLVSAARKEDKAVFAHGERGFGFPALLDADIISVVEKQINDGRRSIQALARTLKAQAYEPPASMAGALFNLNTPEDLESARRRMREL